MAVEEQSILAARIEVPEHVLFQEVTGNSALLNLNTETYYGLDEIGTRMWEVLGEAASVAAAAETLAGEYDAPVETIRTDLVELVADLHARGLVTLSN